MHHSTSKHQCRRRHQNSAAASTTMAMAIKLTSLLALGMVTSITLLSSTSALTPPSFHRRDSYAIKAFIARGSSSSGSSSTKIHSSSVGSWSMDEDGGAPASASRFSWRIMGRSSDNADRQRGGENRREKALKQGGQQQQPYGPISEAALLPTNNTPLSRVRTSVRGVRRRLITSVVNMNGVLRFGNNGNGASSVSNTGVPPPTYQKQHNPRSMLRVGGIIINRRLRKQRAARRAAVSDSSVLAMEQDAIDAWRDVESAVMDKKTTTNILKQGDSSMLSIEVADLTERKHEVISHVYDLAASKIASSALASRGGESTSTMTTSSISSSSSTASTISSNGFSIDSIDTYVIETPLFPIILPKVWEPAAASSTVSAGATVTTNTLEISVAMEQDTTTSSDAVGVAEAKPSPRLLQAATQPLISKEMMGSFTGRELYYPESIEALAQTGIAMTLGSDTNKYVNWSSEKKTDKFLKDHGIDGLYAGNDAAWYEALDTSQEVLVWSGKAIEKTGYGAELPIIKTTSIIHQSPKYLAELLMDSENVKVYNKMSLGRTDAKVFQTGVDKEGGSFGDGESKVVRNLTKPPMVKSLIEFVTCMHARKLRPSDMKLLSPNANNNGEEDASRSEGGYIVVSRAVTGGEWTVENPDEHVSPTGEKLVRNEILLGVNILKAVPGEPDKTELIAVTHVYSPMIPAMLAKSAGVKAAGDFVRDIRALP